jgi:hypothetical protein
MTTGVLEPNWVEERESGEGEVRVRHITNGQPINAGLTFHVLETHDRGTWYPIARVDCVLTSWRSTPVMAWLIAAPGSFLPVPDLWLSCRAFATEGDGIDALWRLHDLYVAGELPNDIRNAV